MSATITIHDETSSGQKTNSFTIECLTEKLTVKDLIQARIFQEVQDYNLKEPEFFRGLVEPSNAERVLNGYRLKAPPQDRLAGTISACHRGLRPERLFHTCRQPAGRIFG